MLSHRSPQSPQLPDGGALLAVYDKSGYSHSETSLAAVIYMSSQVRSPVPRSPGGAPRPARPHDRPPSFQDKIVISRDEVITNNGDTKRLPYHTRTSPRPRRAPRPP